MYYRTLFSATTVSILVTACATAPEPSPRLIAAEAALSSAKADKETMEMGRASLEKADEFLVLAQDAHADRKDEDFTHYVRLTEGFTELAEVRGAQREADDRISSLKQRQADITAENRARELEAERQARQTAERQATIAERRAAAAAERIQTLQSDLRIATSKKVDDGRTLVLQDLGFSTDSAILQPGAQSRLQPLVTFLKEEDDAQIRIEGHTDAQGSDEYNRDLSQKRAQSVKAFLVSNGVDDNRISALGLGEDVPVATNNTSAGRAQNRRVEVTILD
ncbi:MAG: OmpA family protein [Pseudomonadota bacterium]